MEEEELKPNYGQPDQVQDQPSAAEIEAKAKSIEALQEFKKDLTRRGKI